MSSHFANLMPMPETVTLELLGVARLLTRRETLEIALPDAAPVAAFLERVAAEAPALVGTVIADDGTLLGGHALSRRGVELLRDPEAVVRPGEHLLLISTTAGG